MAAVLQPWNVKVYGVTGAIAKLRSIGGYATLQTGYIVYNSARRLAKQAQDNVHVVSGNLHSGISAKKLGPFDWMVVASSLEGDVPEKNDKEYAGFVEYGTSNMAAEPYMRPAVDVERRALVVDVAALAVKIESM